MTRVLGVVMARDEWPALALNITHALSLVDRVLVIDHCSTDGTAAGLASLGEQHGDRVEVLRLDDTPYWQEAITNFALARRGLDDVDWVYVFDADEYLLLGEGRTLADVLDEAPQHCAAVRYEVQNFVVPVDFDPTNPHDYERVQHRSLPCDAIDLPPLLAADEIVHGNLNFFDLHFDSKVVVRAGVRPWFFAGTHHAACDGEMVEHPIAPELIRAAHLPFDGFDRLATKAAHGRRLRDQGFPAHHGWQSQMLAQLDDEGRLQQFWAAHSIAPADDAGTDRPTTLPTTVVDVALADACRAAAAALTPELAAPALSPVSPAPEHVPVAGVLAALRAAQLARTTATGTASDLAEQLAIERAAAASARRRRDEVQLHNNWLRDELEGLWTAHHALGARLQVADQQLATLQAEHEAQRAELQAALATAEAELEQLTAHCDDIDRHRADLQRELEAMRATFVWRWSAPLRRLRARIRS